jgi:putative colanic acid biosynthesis acetyltransferase WcaF
MPGDRTNGSQSDHVVLNRRLSGFTARGYDKGRPLLTQALWFAVMNLVFMKWWCPARLRVSILRAFGAEIGAGVVIRHRVRVLWPWKLRIADNVWIGESAWLLNLEMIDIGHDVCVSQDAFLCTGSHLRRSPTFDYDNGPIVLESAVWIGARATVLRGVTVGRGAVVSAGGVIRKDVEPGRLVL